MKKKGRYIILIIILIVYFVVMYFMFGKDNLKKEQLEGKILIGNNTIWQLKDKKWTNITNNAEIKKLDWQKFQVYLANKHAGNFYLWHDDKWYLFDKDKNAINYSGDILAIQANYEVEVTDFTTTKISDFTYVNQVLEQNGLSTTQDYTTTTQINSDIDQDGTEEVFYVISNAFNTDTKPEKLFSIVFMVKNNQIAMLYNLIDTNKGTNGCKPYLNSILDANGDGKKELILTCAKYSVAEPVQMLYQYDNQEFKILVSNQ